MHPIAAAALITWRRNGAYALRLVGELSPEQFVAQPAGLAPGVLMNHPAWVLSHLNVYAAICAAMLRRRAFQDPIDHRYGQKSKVVPALSEYAPPAALVAEYQRLHEQAEAALVEAGAAGEIAAAAGRRNIEAVRVSDVRGMPGAHGTAGTEDPDGGAKAVFADPNPLERWRTMNPTVGDMIITLMVKHESGHLGQLSAWRRAMGLASVPM